MKSDGLIGLVTVGVMAGLFGCSGEWKVQDHDAASDLDPLAAPRYVDDVRIGRGVDPEGEIPLELRSDTFAGGESVHIAMAVTSAPAGSPIRVSVFDAQTESRVWMAEQMPAPGRSRLHFLIYDQKLADGKYLAKIMVGNETVAVRSFRVSSTRVGGTDRQSAVSASSSLG